MNRQEYDEFMFGVCSAQEDIDVKQEYINSLEILNKELEQRNKISNSKCSDCLHYAMGTCIFKRNCEMQGGISGYCYIEIDNPDEHYCADYEDRIK